MGFFPNLFKIPKGDLIPNIITGGGYGLGKGSIIEAIKVGRPVIRSLASLVRSARAPEAARNRISYGSSIYGSQPYFPAGGYSPWDSSMTYPTFSEVPLPYQEAGFSQQPSTFSPLDQWPPGFSR